MTRTASHDGAVAGKWSRASWHASSPLLAQGGLYGSGDQLEALRYLAKERGKTQREMTRAAAAAAIMPATGHQA